MAEYTPSYKPFKDLGKFRFWVQKVIPLVYDDSLSYYELLAKVVNYLNITTQNVENLNENFIEMKKFLEEYDFEGYEQVIIDTLDEWAENGRLDEIFDDWSGVESIQRSYPKNVLDLGFDNTGANDISALFNQYTQEYALYFPAGTYLVSQPLYPKNDVVGAGRCRHESDCYRDGVTTFTSSLNIEEGQTVGLFNINDNSQYGIRFYEFNMILNSIECGLVFTGNVRKSYFDIDNISVFKLHNYGIYANPSNFRSRYLYIKNYTAFGRDRSNGSGGIALYANAGDCMLENLEIMGCKTGIYLDGTNVRLTNAHIWCGLYVTGDTSAWWRSTRAIDLHNARLICSNIYLDTVFRGIYAYNNAVCNASNVFIWYDSTPESSTNNMNANLVLIQGTPNFTPKVTINGLSGFTGKYLSALVAAWSNNSGVSDFILSQGNMCVISNCCLTVPGTLGTPRNYDKNTYMSFPCTPYVSDRAYGINYSSPIDATYYEIARAHVMYGVNSSFTYVTNDGKSGKVTVTQGSDRGNGALFVSHEPYSGDAQIYYKYSTASSAGAEQYMLTVYEKYVATESSPSSHAIDVTIDNSVRNCNWLIYNDVRRGEGDGSNHNFPRDVTTDGTGKVRAYANGSITLTSTNDKVIFDNYVLNAITHGNYKSLTVYVGTRDSDYAMEKNSLTIPITKSFLETMTSNAGYTIRFTSTTFKGITDDYELFVHRVPIKIDTTGVAINAPVNLLKITENTHTYINDANTSYVQWVVLE